VALSLNIVIYLSNETLTFPCQSSKGIQIVQITHGYIFNNLYLEEKKKKNKSKHFVSVEMLNI